MKEQPKSTKNTPRDPPKLHFYCITSGYKFAARLHKRNGERVRESEEKFGQHGVAMRIDTKMRRGGLILREGERRDPPCMHYKCHSKRRKLIQGGGTHHERGGTPTRRGNSKNGGINLLS